MAFRIITGCPRSGTGFMARLFTEAGIACGHEQKHGFEHGFRVDNPQAESSWMAEADTETIHIVRNPLEVVSSMITRRFLEDDMRGNEYTKFAFDNVPELKGLSGFNRYMYFWIAWNRRIEKQTKKRFRIEDIDNDKEGFIKEYCTPKNIYKNERYNANEIRKILKLEDIPDSKIKEEFIEMAERYGYDIKTKKVWVAILNQGWIRPELSALVLKMFSNSKYQIKIEYPNAQPVSCNRNQISKRFLESGYDYLLMIDADTVPTKNPLDNIELDKDILTCPTPQWRDGDIYWVVMDRVEDGYKPIPSSRRVGVQEVDGVGGACLLIKRAVLEEVKEPFVDKYRNNALYTLGEDFNFCEKAKQAGFKIWANWNTPCNHHKEIGIINVLNLL